MSERLDILAGEGDNVLIGYEELITAVGAEKAEEIVNEIRAQTGARPRRAGVVRQAPYSKLGSRFVGVPLKLALAAGATYTTTVYATQAFNAERFVIPRAIAAQTVITQWVIGDKVILWSPATAPLHCEVFAPDCFSNVHIELDTIDKTRGMDMTFQNVHASAATDIYGSFQGTGAVS